MCPSKGRWKPWEFGSVKNKDERGHNRWFFYGFWNSNRSCAPAVSDLTKPAEITIKDYCKDDYQYEEVID